MEDFFDRFQAVVGISKYSNSEVITPLNIAKDMVDLLPAAIFKPEAKFLDPAVKSGRFLAEIYRRLMGSPLLLHMDEQSRRQHILENQLYGLATSATAAAIVRKQLYDGPTIAGNVVHTEGKVTKELIQGAFEIMKFDVVIGNPPYNKGMDLDFIDMGFELSKQYTAMITPAKWQTADANQGVASKNMTYGKFREKLVPHMSKVVFYPECSDVFGIAQADGITYFLIDKDTHATCVVENRCKLQSLFNSTATRDISKEQSLLNIGQEIVDYLGQYTRWAWPPLTKGRFEVWLNIQLLVRGSGGGISCLLMKDGDTQVVQRPHVLDTEAGDFITSNASVCVYRANSIDECKSLESWINCKFTRFFVLMNISKLTGILTNHYWRFVPAPPSGKFDHIYTDAELYEAFNLPQKYIDVIEAVIKERK